MTRRRHRPAAGFTLIEVVVGIAVFALLMSALYGAFATAVRAYEAAERRTEQGVRLRVVSAFLRRSLGDTFPIALAGRRGWSQIFEGERGRVRYAADLPGYLGVGGMHEIILETERGENGRRLVMRRRPLFVDRRAGELLGELESEVLLEGVDEVSLRYFGGRMPTDAPTWHAEWPAGKQMPVLVELRITDQDGSEWPLLVVRPRVDTVRYQSAVGFSPQEPDPNAASAQPEASGDTNQEAVR